MTPAVFFARPYYSCPSGKEVHAFCQKIKIHNLSCFLCVIHFNWVVENLS